LSIEPRLIKIADTAPSETTRADEIAIETAKTSKVTAVVAVMSIFSKKDASHGALISEMKAFLLKGGKCWFSGGKFLRTKKPFSEIKKRLDTKEINDEIKEVRAKLHYLRAKKQKRHAQIAPKCLIQPLALD
jgi:hypothetical protein